jgi:hypothetical protein
MWHPVNSGKICRPGICPNRTCIGKASDSEATAVYRAAAELVKPERDKFMGNVHRLPIFDDEWICEPVTSLIHHASSFRWGRDRQLRNPKH